MLLKTILNRIQKFSSFVYKTVRIVEEEGEPILVEIEIVPRRNGRLLCSICHQVAPHYDTFQQVRRFSFVPIWGIPCFLLYVMRRVNCSTCGVHVEAVPWAEGKQRTTHAFSWFLATWAKRLSWKETAEAFHVGWDTVAGAVRRAVEWGLKHRQLEDIEAIGVDEIAYRRHHKYLTLVYQIDTHRKRLIWVGKDRKAKTLQKFFDEFGLERTQRLKFVCSDMWKAYLKVVADRAKGALNILDRFHIMSMLGKAIDKTRAEEARRLKSDGYEPILKGTRFLLLKRPENLTDRQEIKLADLLRYNLTTVRAYLLKEDFQNFWDYQSPYWAGTFLDKWCKRAMRSRIQPMKKVAKSMRRHRTLLLNYFKAKARLSSGIVEGFNNKAKLTTRKGYGFRSFDGVKVALFHTLGDLPTPEDTHRFA